MSSCRGLPAREDSGYFSDSDALLQAKQDIADDDRRNDNDEPDRVLGGSVHRSLRRADSKDSLRSHISNVSSQYWEGLSAPDSEALLEIDHLESQYQPVQEPQNDTKPECGIKVEIAHNEPVATKESIQTDGPQASQSMIQHPKPEMSAKDSDSSVFADPNPSPAPLEPSTHSSAFSTTEAIVVSHSDHHQRYFDKHKFPWGVQWEIARLVSSGRIKYDDMSMSDLSQLAGTSNETGAPLVEQLLCGQKGDMQKRQLYNEAFAKELNIRAPWVELDKEEEYLAQDALSGLGSSGLQDDWYGGKVSFVARLRQKDQPSRKNAVPEYFLELEPPELSTSNRFARRWGSRRFLRVRISQDMFPKYADKAAEHDFVEYCSRPIVIQGKVFRPFYAKHLSVFLLEVDQTYQKHHLVLDPNPAKLSLEKFIEWHNPMQLNANQSLAKWCARMALGLSNSVPGIEFSVEDIKEIDDIYTSNGRAALAAGLKPDAKDIMTDGCGFASMKTFVDAKTRYGWDVVPSAVQFRIGGNKGLLLRHPEDNGGMDDPPTLWVRPSQTKISYDPDAPRDRGHLILDILRRSRLTYPAKLSSEIIVNLAENGVSYEVFERLMIDGLDEIAATLTQWSGPFAMQNLWAGVARLGSVIQTRMSREAAGSARVLGFSAGFHDEEPENEDEDEEAIDIAAHSKAWWADEISGCPSTLEETVLVLLDAGFEPQSCHILAFKLREVFKKALRAYIEHYRIVVPCSAAAWIVPDPCGVLEPGEIFLRTSESIIGSDGMRTDHLLGDVLVTRHPCRVPSDVQKVRGVWKEQLRGYFDVIIFSTKGKRSLASVLGGGDYDGDIGHVLWDPNVVAAFKNADEKFADPPQGLQDAFEKDTITVGDFLEKHRKSHEAMVLERETYLLAALKNVSLIGSYSNWQDTAVYRFGYDSDEAWRLAYMFCEVLDSCKSGKTVKSEICRQDKLKYHKSTPEWKVPLSKESEIRSPYEGITPRREGHLKLMQFIMDQLKATARKQYDHHMICFDKFLEESRRNFKAQRSIDSSLLYIDPALEAPWNDAMQRARELKAMDNQDRMEKELNVIREHVKAVGEQHLKLVRLDGVRSKKSNPHSATPRKDAHSFTKKPIELRQNILREISLSFSHVDFKFIALSQEDVRRCKASYAYILETTRHEKYSNDNANSPFARFPFDVAMRELGIIKAASIGACNMVSSRFYSVFNVTGAIKAFRPATGQAYTY